MTEAMPTAMPKAARMVRIRCAVSAPNVRRMKSCGAMSSPVERERGIERRGASRWKNAARDAADHGHGERRDHRPERRERGQDGINAADGQTAELAEDRAGDAADPRQHDRLGEEKPAD